MAATASMNLGQSATVCELSNDCPKIRGLLPNAYVLGVRDASSFAGAVLGTKMRAARYIFRMYVVSWVRREL